MKTFASPPRLPVSAISVGSTVIPNWMGAHLMFDDFWDFFLSLLLHLEFVVVVLLFVVALREYIFP